MQLIYSFALALFLTVALMPLLIRMSPRLGLMDVPGEARKVHQRVIPRSGGLAMALGVFVPALLLLPKGDPLWLSVLAGALVIVIFGFLDDQRDLHYRWKFAGQTLAVLIVMAGGVVIEYLPFMGLDPAPPWLTYPVTFLFLLGVTNAVNLSDGLDGLAAGTTLIALAMISLFAYLCTERTVLLLALTTMGCVFGFLRYNTFPARVFMGDAGSQFLGFIAAVLVILVTQSDGGAISPMLAVLILGLPILDTFTVMAIRLWQRRSPFSPDRNHLHHQIMDLGLRHYEAVALIYILQIVLMGAAFGLRYESDALLLGVYAGFSGLLLGGLTLARQLGWRVRAAAEVELGAEGERRNTLLRRIGVLYHWWPTIVQALLGLLLLGVALTLLPAATPTFVQQAAAWASLPLLLLLSLVCRWPGLVVRTCVYSAALGLAFLLTEGEIFRFGVAWVNVALVVLVGVLVLAIRMTRREQFRLDTQDLLMLVVVLGAPMIPVEGFNEWAIGEIALRLAILMYSCEFLLGRTGGRGLWPVSAAAVASVVIIGIPWWWP